MHFLRIASLQKISGCVRIGCGYRHTTQGTLPCSLLAHYCVIYVPSLCLWRRRQAHHYTIGDRLEVHSPRAHQPLSFKLANRNRNIACLSYVALCILHDVFREISLINGCAKVSFYKELHGCSNTLTDYWLCWWHIPPDARRLEGLRMALP